MEKFSRQFAYQNKLVFLICDYYEDKYMPKNMYDVASNLTLFPVNNYPLIDYILQNLCEQNFTHVVLVGNKIEKVIRHIMKSKFDILLKIAHLSNDVILQTDSQYQYNLDNIGQFFRVLLEFNITNDFLIYTANQYTTFDLLLLKSIHTIKKALATFYIYENTTNDPEFFNYDFSSTGRMFGVEKNKKKVTEMSRKYNAPGIFYTTPEISRLFNEFPDARNIPQLIEELKSTFAFGQFKFYSISENILTTCNYNLIKGGNKIKPAPNDIMGMDKTTEIVKVLKNHFKFSDQECEQIKTYETHMIHMDNDKYYFNREITTLMDYINLCNTLSKYTDVLLCNIRLRETKNTIYNAVCSSTDMMIQKMNQLQIAADSYKNLFKIQEYNNGDNPDNKYMIELKTGEMVNCSEIEIELFSCKDSSEENTKEECFFDQCIDYLKDKFKEPEVDMCQITKNITLFKIYWNTTPEEVLEAYASFFTEIITDTIDTNEEQDDANMLDDIDLWEKIEDLICSSATLFCLLSNEFANNKHELQKYFIQELLDNIQNDIPNEIGVKSFYAYCYLFKTCKTIKKSIVNGILNELNSTNQ